MAEARHRQVLAGYWPQVNLQGGYHVMDEFLNFLFPSSTMALPPMTIPGMGTMEMGEIAVPTQEIKLMGKETLKATIQAAWLLYDGGQRKGYQEQAKAYVEIMKQESRRTDLEIMDRVKRLYYGSVLAMQLHILGMDSLERMETILDLTEAMYKQGSGRVKKTDWLENKIMVETLRSMVAMLEKNELLARAALANTMGFQRKTHRRRNSLRILW